MRDVMEGPDGSFNKLMFTAHPYLHENVRVCTCRRYNNPEWASMFFDVECTNCGGRGTPPIPFQCFDDV